MYIPTRSNSRLNINRYRTALEGQLILLMERWWIFKYFLKYDRDRVAELQKYARLPKNFRHEYNT